jgi:hypothetical protein
LVPVIYSESSGKERLAGLAAYLAKEGAMKERAFRSICRQAGAELALQAAAAARQAGLGRREWRVYPMGGVLVGNGAVRREFLRRLRCLTGGVFVARPVLTPVLGAAAMALKAGGIRLTPEIIANLSRSGT